jgi:4'-phosphopantetheinyl transferase
MVPFSFIPPPSDLQLPNDEIHIWCTSLDQPASSVDGLFCTLSIHERARAERFYFEEDRKRFIVRHGILRMILRYYLGVGATELRFCYGWNGKPRVAHPFDNGTIFFSMSSSTGLALFALTLDREIGVDIERIRNISEMDQIVERIFSLREKAVFQKLPENQKKGAFFNCWTRKEAFVKATGDGLSRPLGKFELTVDPSEPARLLAIDGDRKSACRWSIHDLKPASGFAAAIAAEGLSGRLRFWQWTNGNAPQVSTEDMS